MLAIIQVLETKQIKRSSDQRYSEMRTHNKQTLLFAFSLFSFQVIR